MSDFLKIIKKPYFIPGIVLVCWSIFLIIFIVSLLLVSKAEAKVCEISEVPGAPKIQHALDKTERQIICRSGYQLAYNYDTKTPSWVMEHIRGDSVQSVYKRVDSFTTDPLVPDTNEANLNDYKNSGYARGHMAPAGDFRDPIEIRESFFLTNMVPQIQRCNNSGIWSDLERTVRNWAVKYGEVYVVTGPIYDPNEDPKYIGNNVRIPDALFKTIWNPAMTETLSFIIPNEELCRMDASDFIVHQAEVENSIGFFVFPNILVQSSRRMWPE